MLQLLRKGAASWVAKGLLGLLVVSFGIWGIADVFRGGTSVTVAEVGGRHVTVDQFRNAYQQRVREVGQRRGRPLSPAEAQALGVGPSTLSTLVAEAALDERAGQLGLSISDDLLAAQVRNDPAFQGPTGSFDRVRFAQIIRSNGLTEAGLLADERERSQREQLVDAMTGAIAAPLVLRDGLTRYLGETRAVDYVVVTPDSIADVPAPDEAALRTFYDERKSAFRSPEFRKVTVLELTPAAISAAQSVTDDEVKASYEARKAEFVAPEKRGIGQIAFPSDADADAASAKIAAGASFDDIARERNLDAADIDLGTVAKAEMFDPAVADAAFALAEGATSRPVKGSFGTVILRVGKIEPGQTQPVAQISDRLRHDLQLRKAQDAVLDAHDRIEDARAGGATLAEIAPKFGATARTVERIDRSGKDASGAPVDGLPAADKLLPEIFAGDPGVDTDEVSAPDGGYVWYTVEDVFPSRERTFDEAKADVAVRWTETRRGQLAGEEAAALLDKLKAGGSLASAAAQSGLAVKTAAKVSRGGSPPDIGRAAASAIFAVAPNGGVGTATAEEAGARLVFRVAGSDLPAADAPTSEAAAERLRQGLAGDLGVQYLQRAQNDLGVTYDRRNINNVIGTPEG